MPASTLRRGYAKRLVEKPDSSSNQRMIPAPTQVGGGARLQSAQGVSRVSFLARREGRGAAPRRDPTPTGKVKSCEPERPQDLTNRESWSRHCGTETLGRARLPC